MNALGKWQQHSTASLVIYPLCSPDNEQFSNDIILTSDMCLARMN